MKGLGRFFLILPVLGLFGTTLTNGEILYTYDSRGQLIGVDYGDGQAIAYTYDEAGNLVTRQVTVEENRLYFPFYQAASGTFLGVAVSNYSNVEAPLRFTAYSKSGEIAAYARNPSTENLAAGKQSARLASEIFQTGNLPQDAWVELESDSADLGSFFQFGNGTLTQLDGSIALSRHNREFHFSRIYQGSGAFRGQRAVTYLSLANPTDQAVTVRLELFTTESAVSGEGSSLFRAAATVERTIPPKGFVYENIVQLFGKDNISEGYVSARIREGSGLVAFELIELPDRTTVIGLNASDGNPSTNLYSAQLADASVIYTSLKLINVSDQPRKLRLTAIGGDGGQLADPQQRALAIGQYLEVDTGQLFGFPTATDLTVGSIKIETDGPGVIGDVVFGDPVGFKYAASMPLQTRKLTEAVFSQVATTANFFTGLAFYNPGSESTDVTIQVYNSAGELKGSEVKTLSAGHRISGLIPELVPSASTVVGGYVLIESSQPLIAQQIFGEAGLNQFSAVPPKTIR